MGNCFQSHQQSEKENTTSDDAIKVSVPVQAPPEKPKPQIFALMRNGHEVIRGNMVDIQDLLDQNDLKKAVESYSNLHKWMEVHKLMEEGNLDGKTPMGFFSVLDERFDGIAKEKGLCDDHSNLEDIEASIAEAGKEGNIETFKKKFDEYKTSNEAHLAKEEEVMMPRVMKLSKSGVNMKELMVNEILSLVVDSPDFQFFVQHANYILDKHAGGKPRARVFDHALWICATPEQWNQWRAWIEASLPETKFRAIMEDIEVL